VLDEPRDAARTAATRVENEPSFSLPQSMLDRVEVEAQALEQVPILDGRLLDEGIALVHRRLSVRTNAGMVRAGR
jgi:hypothetical protein